MQTTLALSVKILQFKTNYNNKLSCQNFIHIDLAPRQRIPESRLSSTIYEIRCLDGSTEPVRAQLLDLARIPLNNISNVLTWQSHGMLASDFKRWFMQNGKGINQNTEMAIYFYSRMGLDL